MNQMPAFDTSDLKPDDGHSPRMAPASYTVKRTGQRPIKFEGSELCMAMSFVPDTPFWYEINIYRTVSQGFVLAVRLFFQSEDERDRIRAWEFQTFDEVLDCLEGYDAGHDVRVGRFGHEPGLPVAALAAEAFALRARVEAQRDQFSSLLGEVLEELAG